MNKRSHVWIACAYVIIFIAIFVALGWLFIDSHKKTDLLASQERRLTALNSLFLTFRGEVWEKEADATSTEEEAQEKLEKEDNAYLFNTNLSGFDVKKTNKTVLLSDPQNGISFNIPYDDTWMDSKHPLDPYEKIDQSAYSLVPLQYPGAGSFPWLFVLNIHPAGRLSILGDKVNAPPDYFDDSSLKLINIDGFRVVKGLKLNDECGSEPLMVVMGKRFEYEFYSDRIEAGSQAENQQKVYDYLEAIIKTVKLDKGF